MRNSDTATIAALEAAPTSGLAARSLVWITAPSRETGDLRSFGFWNDRLPVTMSVVSGQNGSNESRLYEADGALMSVGKMTLTSDISVRNASFVLSLLHPTVELMYRNYRLKLAKVEIHRAALDPLSHLLVAPPRCRFVGTIDGADKKTPKIGGEGGLTIKVISQTAELTITNPAKRSDETQRRRDDDRHSKYADVVNQWDIYWGQSS